MAGGVGNTPFFGQLPLNKCPYNDFAEGKTIPLSAVTQILYSRLSNNELKSVIIVLFVILKISFHFCASLIFSLGTKLLVELRFTFCLIQDS